MKKIMLLALLLVLATGIGAARAETIVKRILVDMPYPVAVADKVLEPARLEIREISDHALQFFNRDELKVEATVITIPTFDRKPSEATKVVLRKFGDNEYYIDKIWLQGRNYGYEFLIPERVRSWQQEHAMSPEVSGTYEEVSQEQLGG